MAESRPIVVVPCLGSSARTHIDILPGLWRHGPVSVANHTRDDTIAGMARRALEEAPAGPFALIGHSLGGYIVLEMIRREPHRIVRLALLNTSARPDRPEATKLRNERVAETKAGRYAEVRAASFPLSVHPDRVNDAALKEMSRLTGEDSGPEAFIRPQAAIIARIDSRPYARRTASETSSLARSARARVAASIIASLMVRARTSSAPRKINGNPRTLLTWLG